VADFLQYCEQFSQLDQETIDDLFQNLKTKTYKKGDFLLRSGETCRHLFFINEGLAKSFFYNNDKEFIMRFFSENVLFTVFDSYLTQEPSNFTVVTLETTTVTLISYEKMESLCKKHHCMETFFRKLISVASIKMMKRISEMLEEDATRRYNKFVQDNNSILQRISLILGKTDGEYKLVGDLTILETTNKIQLDVEHTGIGKGRFDDVRAGFEVSGKINRRDFGLQFHLLNEAGNLVVGNDIKLNCDIELIKEA